MGSGQWAVSGECLVRVPAEPGWMCSAQFISFKLGGSFDQNNRKDFVGYA